MTLGFTLPSVISTVKNFASAFSTVSNTAKLAAETTEAVATATDVAKIATEKRAIADQLANNFLGQQTKLNKQVIDDIAARVVAEEGLSEVEKKKLIQDELIARNIKGKNGAKANHVEAIMAEVGALEAESAAETQSAAAGDVNTASQERQIAAEKTHIIPFSLKCICKIILTLLQNKFKNITKIQKISFISRFFFDTILLPIFENPTLGAFINEYIISGKTFESLKIISGVISQFCLGKFYIQDIKKGYYTPFNLYFIEKIPKLYQFFDSLTDVTLPPFIDKLINDKLPNNYKFSIFKDNPYENYYYRSMVFSFDEIYILINTIINCKSKLTFDEKSKPLEIVINKLTNEYSMTTINEIRDSEKKKEEEYEKIKSPDKKLAKKKYVIHSELLYNDKMSYLMKINQEKPNFNLEQLKNVENNNDNQKDNLIKVKNLIYSILYNIDNLKTSHFKQKDLTNLLNILNCLKKYIESLNIVIDGNVPLEWYATSLLEYIKLIPENMKKNDYELLFADMENDLKKSIL